MLIDLNADIAEGYAYQGLLRWVNSVNIACGGHAGDQRSMSEAVQSALPLGLKIGAHPSYPDRHGFGRREMDFKEGELVDLLQNQVTALDQIARQHGAKLSHVKPHGALYNRCARDPAVARVVARAIYDMNAGLSVVGLAGSQARQAALEIGLPFIGEAFADRRYEPSGALVSRSHPKALITDPAEAAQQAREIALHGRISAIDGSTFAIEAKTLCIHSDTPQAAEIAKAVAAVVRGQ